MARSLCMTLVLVAAVAEAIAAQPLASPNRSKATPPAEAPRAPADIAELEREGPSTKSFAAVHPSVLSFGSGLEEDAPIPALGIMPPLDPEETWVDPAEGLRSMVLRFGSGLEEDTPGRGAEVLLESGLEEASVRQVPAPASGVHRFGSGLEEDAPALAANTRFRSGLEDDAPGPRFNVLQQPGF